MDCADSAEFGPNSTRGRRGVRSTLAVGNSRRRVAPIRRSASCSSVSWRSRPTRSSVPFSSPGRTTHARRGLLPPAIRSFDACGRIPGNEPRHEPLPCGQRHGNRAQRRERHGHHHRCRAGVVERDGQEQFRCVCGRRRYGCGVRVGISQPASAAVPYIPAVTLTLRPNPERKSIMVPVVPVRVEEHTTAKSRDDAEQRVDCD